MQREVQFYMQLLVKMFKLKLMLPMKMQLKEEMFSAIEIQ